MKDGDARVSRHLPYVAGLIASMNILQKLSVKTIYYSGRVFISQVFPFFY